MTSGGSALWCATRRISSVACGGVKRCSVTWVRWERPVQGGRKSGRKGQQPHPPPRAEARHRVVLRRQRSSLLSIHAASYPVGRVVHIESCPSQLWAATYASRMANGIAHREQPYEVSFEIPGPITEVLQTLVPGLEKIPVEPGCVIALLDQLDLQRAGIRQR